MSAALQNLNSLLQQAQTLKLSAPLHVDAIFPAQLAPQHCPSLSPRPLTSDCTKAHSYMLGSPCRPSRVLSAMRAAAYAILRVALPPPALASTTSVPASCTDDGPAHAQHGRVTHHANAKRYRDTRKVACRPPMQRFLCGVCAWKYCAGDCAGWDMTVRRCRWYCTCAPMPVMPARVPVSAW